MRKSKVIFLLAIICVALLAFGVKLGSFLPHQKQNSPHSTQVKNNLISPEVQQRLKKQAINQFYSLVDYDLEALQEYAPKDEEMNAYYKIFDENAFQEKYNLFAKNYTAQGMNYGEDAFYDRDLIMRVGTEAAVLRARSNLLNSEKIRLGDDPIELDTVYSKRNRANDELFDLHIRFYHPKSEGYYEFVNEACWLTDRTCINTLSWKFLGRYNKYTKQYAFSQLNLKNL